MWIYYAMLALTAFWDYPKLPKIGESFTVIKMVGVAVIIVAAARAITHSRYMELLRWSEGWLFLLYFCWAVVSGTVISESIYSTMPVQIYVSVMAYLLATLVLVDSLEKLNTSIYVFLISIVLAAYSVFTQAFRYGASRPGGIIGDSNYFSLVASCALPFAIFFCPVVSGIRRWFLAGSAVLFIGATLISGSRGGILCLAVCFCYVLLRSSKRLLFLCIAVPIVAIAITVLPQTGLDRFRNEDYGTSVSTEHRREMIQSGLRMIATNPLTGVGVGMFKPTVVLYAGPEAEAMAHNTYIEVAAELGVPGLLTFIAILACTWWRALGTARVFEQHGNVLGENTARAIEAAIVVYAVGAAFLSAEYAKQIWIIVAFGMVLASVAEYEPEPALEGQTVSPAEEVYPDLAGDPGVA